MYQLIKDQILNDKLNEVIKEYGLTDLTIKIKKINRGWASYKGYVSIPVWSLRYGVSYYIYYILHELAHHIQYRKDGYFSHDNKFKDIERTLLGKFGMTIEYKRAYPKYLRRISDGEIVYDGKPVTQGGNNE